MSFSFGRVAHPQRALHLGNLLWPPSSVALACQQRRCISCSSPRCSSSSEKDGSKSSNSSKWFAVGGIVACAGLGYYFTRPKEVKTLVTEVTKADQKSEPVKTENSKPNEEKGEDTGKSHHHKVPAGIFRDDLPTFSLDEVRKHKRKEDGVWVTYKNGVYDVTNYIAQHPGGTKILLAAGGDITPFWNMYGAHYQSEIFAILEELRIGNITEVEEVKKTDQSDPYFNDPKRHPALIPSSSKPFNAEPPVSLLVQDYITPNDAFYVRNHLPVPDIDPKKYNLNVANGDQDKTLNLDALRTKFEQKTVAATLQCAGNRRSDMVKIKSVKGLNWGIAAIGTAEWTGPTLNDVLKYCGIDIDTVNCKHIQFEGEDTGPDGTTYGASIPIELARNLKSEILIAHKMNGVDIPRDHGYPVRVIIPGIVGARQVKWLNKILISQEESLSHWQQRDYKGFNSSVDWHNVDFDKSEAIQMLPVQSAICEPEEGQTLDDGEEVTVKGYAWSGGGRGIYRVDISVDGGKTWTTADLEAKKQSPYTAWAWCLWEATVPLPADHGGKVEIVCKACDSQYNVQPDSVEGIWNLRGCLSNAWHRVHVNVP